MTNRHILVPGAYVSKQISKSASDSKAQCATWQSGNKMQSQTRLFHLLLSMHSTHMLLKSPHGPQGTMRHKAPLSHCIKTCNCQLPPDGCSTHASLLIQSCAHKCINSTALFEGVLSANCSGATVACCCSLSYRYTVPKLMAYGASSEAALATLKYYKESQSSFIAGRESSTNRSHPLKPDSG